MSCHVLALSASRNQVIAPAVDWLRLRSVEAALVNIYAARPPVWIGQVAEGVVSRFELGRTRVLYTRIPPVLPLPDTSVSSVRRQYRYRKLR